VDKLDFSRLLRVESQTRPGALKVQGPKTDDEADAKTWHEEFPPSQ